MFEENNSPIYFDEILSSAMERQGLGCLALDRLMNERGNNIVFQSISAYTRGVRVPPYERAKALLDALDEIISEEELIEILEVSREKLKLQEKYLLEEETEIRKTITIRIKPKNISPELTVYQGMRILEERIRDLFGEENKFSDYVKMLITKDLKEFILEEQDIKEE